MLNSLITLYDEECLVSCLFGYILIYIYQLIEQDKDGFQKKYNKEMNLLNKSIHLYNNRLIKECDNYLVDYYKQCIYFFIIRYSNYYKYIHIINYNYSLYN